MALTPPQVQELRRRILERRRQLAGATHDTGDESVADLLADLGQAELSRDLAELRDLEAARLRLAGGSYGICTDCVACQGHYEKTHAGSGTPTL